jgi:hypothetical protein
MPIVTQLLAHYVHKRFAVADTEEIPWAWHGSLRRLQSGRIDPVVQMRGGVGLTRAPQQSLTVDTGRKLGSLIARGLREGA